MIWRILFAYSVFIGTTVDASAQSFCECSSGDYKVSFKDKIVVCGSKMKQLKEEIILTSVSIKDCLKNEVLSDNSADAVQQYSVRKYSDSLVVTDLVLLPDSTMKGVYGPVPLSSRALKLINRSGKERVYFGSSRFVLQVPSLNSIQKKYLDRLCGRLNSNIKKPAAFYPGDEASIYALFLGAVNQYRNCYDLFRNLESYFVLDGAIAETRSEIPFDYVVENLKER